MTTSEMVRFRVVTRRDGEDAGVGGLVRWGGVGWGDGGDGELGVGWWGKERWEIGYTGVDCGKDEGGRGVGMGERWWGRM